MSNYLSSFRISAKKLLSIFLLLFFFTTLHAQEVPFNDLLEAASGNTTPLKLTLIETGWSHDKFESNDDEEFEEDIFYYSYTLFGLEVSAIFIGDDSVLIAQISKSSLYKSVYEELKSNCVLEGVNTFPEENVDYIAYTCSKDIDFAVFTTEGIYYIMGGKLSLPE